MSDRRSYVALDWVNAQIAETLQQAEEALDGFIATPEDITRLRFSLTYLHQVSGSLFMLELHVATILSKEIEKLLARVLENEHVIQPQLEAAKLVRSILPTLAAYLAKVSKTHEDNPQELMDSLNQVREANNEERVSESDIFNPDIAVAMQVEKQQPAMAVEEFNELIRKLRQSFQMGLIGVVRDKDLKANYALISKVCLSLYKASNNTASKPLWHIAFAIADQLSQAEIPASLETKKALKQIDNQIKHLEETGRDALAESPDTTLLKSLLYSVAKADIVTETIVELRKAYHLEQALAESEAQPEITEESAAVRKQISGIIESLRQELSVLTGFDIVEMNDAVIRMQNILRIVGISDLLGVLQEIEHHIHEVIDQGGDINARAELICREVEKIETFLQAWQQRQLPINNEDVSNRFVKYIADLRLDVDAVKQSLAEYVAEDCNADLIRSLPDLMDRLVELLTISPLRLLMPIVAAAQEYIVINLMDAGNKPVSTALQALAEAISSVDYYLERLPADSSENLQTIINVAQESIGRMQNPVPEEVVKAVNDDEEFYDDYSEIPVAEVEETDIPIDFTVEGESLSEEADDNNAMEFMDSVVAEEIPLPVVEEEGPAEENLVAESGENELIFFEPGEEADEEILEIFVEEAREVVDHILEYLPVLENDYDNMDALLEIRRSYHTLKGSGRMVGATFIGDYAWSVERMMNKVRDGLAKVTDNCIAILHLATEGVPALIDGIEHRSGVSKRMWQGVIDRADAEWEGKAAKAEPLEEAVIEETPAVIPLPEVEEVPVTEVDAGKFESLEEMAEDLGLENIAEPVAEEEPIEEELLGIFLGESEMHIKVLSDYLDHIEPGYEDIHVTSELQRALHTLKGSSHMAGVKSIAMLATPLESFVKDLNNYQSPVDADILAMLVRARELLEAQLEGLQRGDMTFVPGINNFVADLKALHSSRIERQEKDTAIEEGFADKYTALLEAALDSMTQAADLVQAWQTESIDSDQQQRLVEVLRQLANTAAEAKYNEIAELSGELSDFYQNAITNDLTFDQDFFMLANKGHDELDDMMDMIAAHQIVEPATDLIAELQGFGKQAAVEMKAPQKSVEKGDAGILSSEWKALREQLLAADPDMLEIFSEESGELMDVLDVLMRDWFENHKDRSGLNEIKRIIHTIKGGARLVDVQVLADLAHAYITDIESAEEHGQCDDDFFSRARAFHSRLASYIDFFISGDYKNSPQETESDKRKALGVDDLQGAEDEFAGIERVDAEIVDTEMVEEESAPVSDFGSLESEPERVSEEMAVFASGIDNEFDEVLSIAGDGIEPYIERENTVEEFDVEKFDVEELGEEAIDESAAIHFESSAEESVLGTGGSDYHQLIEQYRQADQDTLEIFLEEAQELDNELDEAVSEWLSDHEAVQHAAAIKRVLHTLKGGARLAELSVLGDLTHNFESMIEHAEAHKAFDTAFFANVQSYLDQIHGMIEFVVNGANPDAIPVAVPSPVVEEAGPSEETPFIAPDIAEEADVHIDSGEKTEEQVENVLVALAEQYHKADQDTLEIFLEEAQELVNDLEESVGQWVSDHEAVQNADALKRILHTLKGGARLAELAVLGDFTHDFESMIEHAEARKAYSPEFFANMQSCMDQVQQMVDFVAKGAHVGDIETTPAIVAPTMTFSVTEPIAASIEAIEEVVVPVGDDVDTDLLALFVEEAKEQNEGIEECIANFLHDSSDLSPLEELKRLLHTLKGGARLTGLSIIGDLSHDFETFIINSEREKKVNSDTFVDEMQVFHDKLAKLINGIQVVAPAESVSVEEEKPESNIVPINGGRDDSLVSQAAIDATRTFIENFNKDQQQRSNREPVKIAPDLLEDLINLAGESSIGRSRIEEQVNEIVISQGEMDATVDRLHSQLRRLEIETEAQILFRQEQVVQEGQENFDPLEMDRYTQMQQLSKSLIESASDLDDISVTFTNKLRDMETLLLQQARVNTELQEGLMRCQMVPFSRMVPRLRRIVRQVAQELGKKVDFQVENAEGELDRTILERMIAPLEHMLRNGVDHGIEMPDVRRAAGKPEQGTIILSLSREGGEVVLNLRDDGAGVNIAAVRKKAVERGLMAADATLSDHEIAKFILHAGFSTAQKVTQISGRGVGMDVVYNEIKQMGGSLDINSNQGHGSTFIVRLPFTVSVNRALMVTVGTEYYAIPLNSIEGIVRVSPYELEAYYQPDAPMFEYAGQSYYLRYMGSLLHSGHRAKLEGLTTPLPVVLIRSSDYSVAVQVDRLVGSREVVVKSLGPQFSMVSGLSGATVLGDGSVVAILDMLALVRADFAKGLVQGSDRTEEYKPEVVRKQTTVMVVDDSVTVRKVTSRLLERYGFKVILAKDGLDALTQLQEMDELPDIMLLDIEMPRMDGFEVVSRVRHDNRLQHIPITMITSRTGEKHRERALSLGASRYMGKPFQDRELLQTISELTGAEIQQA